MPTPRGLHSLLILFLSCRNAGLPPVSATFLPTGIHEPTGVCSIHGRSHGDGGAIVASVAPPAAACRSRQRLAVERAPS